MSVCVFDCEHGRVWSPDVLLKLRGEAASRPCSFCFPSDLSSLFHLFISTLPCHPPVADGKICKRATQAHSAFRLVRGCRHLWTCWWAKELGVYLSGSLRSHFGSGARIFFSFKFNNVPRGSAQSANRVAPSPGSPTVKSGFILMGSKHAVINLKRDV